MTGEKLHLPPRLTPAYHAYSTPAEQNATKALSGYSIEHPTLQTHQEQERLEEGERVTYRLDQMEATMTLYVGPSTSRDDIGQTTWEHLDCWYGEEGLEMMMRVLPSSGEEGGEKVDEKVGEKHARKEWMKEGMGKWRNLAALVQWRRRVISG
jgi:hypothetical protein